MHFYCFVDFFSEVLYNSGEINNFLYLFTRFLIALIWSMDCQGVLVFAFFQNQIGTRFELGKYVQSF